MNRIRRWLARPAGPPGVVARPASKPQARRAAGPAGPGPMALPAGLSRTRRRPRAWRPVISSSGQATGPRPPAAAVTGNYAQAGRFRCTHHIWPAGDRGGN